MTTVVAIGWKTNKQTNKKKGTVACLVDCDRLNLHPGFPPGLACFFLLLSFFLSFWSLTGPGSRCPGPERACNQGAKRGFASGAAAVQPAPEQPLLVGDHPDRPAVWDSGAHRAAAREKALRPLSTRPDEQRRLELVGVDRMYLHRHVRNGAPPRPAAALL